MVSHWLRMFDWPRVSLDCMGWPESGRFAGSARFSVPLGCVAFGDM
jgi:hypothetical protein